MGTAVCKDKIDNHLAVFKKLICIPWNTFYVFIYVFKIYILRN